MLIPRETRLEKKYDGLLWLEIAGVWVCRWQYLVLGSIGEAITPQQKGFLQQEVERGRERGGREDGDGKGEVVG